MAFDKISFIFLLSSTVNGKGIPNHAAYSATKAAVRSMARSFSAELIERKIRVNALTPGPIDTPVFNKIIPAEQVDPIKQLWVSQVAAGRMGLPSDIGAAAVFLASEGSTFILGSEILVDGGLTNIHLMG